MSSIADDLPVGIWVARAPGGELVYANSMFREIMGIPALTDVARGEYAEPYAIHDRDGRPYPEDAMPFVRALKARETVMVDDIVIHRRDGRRVMIRAYARPHFAGEEISHIVIAFLDISPEVEAQQRRRQSDERTRSSQRMEALGNLAGGIAHDFNNLLGAIQGMASSLRIIESDPDVEDTLGLIESATERGAELARALLTFAGRGKNLAEPVALNQVVRTTTQILSRGLEKRVSLVHDLRSRRAVLGDGALLEQLIINLALNARDAMVEGGTLTIRTFDEGDELVLEVEDQGPGVPPEARARIFEPFFSTRASSRASTGLGLATVYGIVESHQGRIEVDDAADGGALFRVRLPAVEQAPREAWPRTRESVISGQGTILVVDDEPVLLQAAIQVLKSLGYDALGARSGAEAIAMFPEHRDEIRGVLLDMSMPQLDGRHTFLRLREMDPNVRVLLTTGYSLNEEAQDLLRLGVRGFIEKPWNAPRLSHALADILSGD